MTRMGMVLGTAAYMSPEQARGHQADQRSDVWAFGCVLYEMLTGTRVFDMREMSDTIAAVLRAEPDWTKLSAQVPEPITTLLHRCLEKDPKRRLRDIGDARLELDARAESAVSRPDRHSEPPERADRVDNGSGGALTGRPRPRCVGDSPATGISRSAPHHRDTRRVGPAGSRVTGGVTRWPERRVRGRRGRSASRVGAAARRAGVAATARDRRCVCALLVSRTAGRSRSMQTGGSSASTSPADWCAP